MTKQVHQWPLLYVRNPSWKKPPGGLWKINCDAAINKEAMRMGVGIITKDAMGQVLAAKAKLITYIVDPTGSEATAAWHAICFGREVGGSTVILEGDSMVVASALKRGGVSNHVYGHLIEDIRTIFPSFLSIEVSHVKREVNKAAYGLARCALSQLAFR